MDRSHRTRPAPKRLLQWLVASTIFSPSTVAAFNNLNCGGHTRRFGTVDYQATLQTQILNQCHYRTLKRHRSCALPTVCRGTSSDADANATIESKWLSLAEVDHMKQATSLARIGYGNTFPNPAVGCVLVKHDDDDNDSIIGSGFHPKAGMPHAEVFALLEACGHIDDGVAAARSVMGVADETNNDSLSQQVLDLLVTYKSEDGASKLFSDKFKDCDVTAFVTLEPCCHVGQTPPCALSLVAAGVNRVVVGYRDPNPRVAGGGIQVLQNAGIDVHIVGQGDNVKRKEAAAAAECSEVVKYFVKRISPREEPVQNLADVINGKKRRVLRSIAGRQKTDGTIQQMDWPRKVSGSSNNDEDDESSSDFAEQVPLDTRFLERIDASLWDHEIVLLRLNNAVRKKKAAKILGGRIADELDAHVAQVIGHTVLLYRPAFPPVLDLDELATSDI